MSHIIAPSILAADFLNLGKDIEMINTSVAEWVHVDVMDGHFVPNLSFGLPVIKAVKTITKKPLDVHLMINNPQLYIKDYAAAGADHFTVHYEVCNHLHRVLQAIKSEGMKAGVALNPHTPVSLLEDVIHEIDIVCLMSVNPGFGGQRFIEHTYAKVVELRDMIDAVDASTKIEIDGGVTMKNAEDLVNAGADVLVAGSAVFKADSPVNMIQQLKTLS